MFTAQMNVGSVTWGKISLGNWSLGEIALHLALEE